MSINSRRAITLLHTRSYNLDIEVALWNQNQPHIETWKVCKEGQVEDEYHLLFKCFGYSAIRGIYDDILRGVDNLNITLKETGKRLSSYLYALFTQTCCFKVSMSLLRKETHIEITFVLRSYGSILASLWTLNLYVYVCVCVCK